MFKDLQLGNSYSKIDLVKILGEEILKTSKKGF